MTFAPESCCHACTEKPAKVLRHMPFLTNLLQPGGASRSAASTVVISSHSATTRGSVWSPPAWIFERIITASSVLPTFASHLGDRGKNGNPTKRITQGTHWMPQAVRKDAVGPGMKLQPYPIKYMSKIPTSIASCWMTMIEPRLSFFAISARYTGT